MTSLLRPIFFVDYGSKAGSLFGADFEEYKSLEDGQPKSEEGFLEYLKKKNLTLTGGGNEGTLSRLLVQISPRGA